MATNFSGPHCGRRVRIRPLPNTSETKQEKTGLKASKKIDSGRTVLGGSSSGQATIVRRSQLTIGREEGVELQLECEPATSEVRSLEQNEASKRSLPEGKACRMAEIEARFVADDARRIRVLRAW